MHAAIDRSPWENGADAGSKPWLIAQALSEGADSTDCLAVYDLEKRTPCLNSDSDVLHTDNTVSNNDDFDEDRFHIKLPSNVDQYTGVKLDEEEEELPEDRFHKKDAASSYLISQREQAVKDKWAKHEKLEKKSYLLLYLICFACLSFLIYLIQSIPFCLFLGRNQNVKTILIVT